MKFTPELLAGIFLGKINNWSDPAIAQVNPGVKFPNMPIVVAHRSDGSGTTYVFTDYLSKVSPEWNYGGWQRHQREVAGGSWRQGQ